MLEDILERYGITKINLLELNLKSVNVFDDGEVVNDYIDNGRTDIITRKLLEPFVHENKEIVGYTMYDKYVFGREQQTMTKFALTLYYKN
jgi:hypothetical protein